ncbi:unnamed protein product, partial [Owenia fusiformis]
CNPGYVGNGVTCENTNECLQGIFECPLYSTCVDNVGSYVCNCDTGFVEIANQCTDIDECSDNNLNNCDVDATCVNQVGSYLCYCNQGYLGDGNICSAINQCTDVVSPLTCDANAVCIHEFGGSVCQCNEGYTGDGIMC